MTPDPADRIRQALDEPGCIICTNELRDDETQTCLPCYTRTRTLILETTDLYATLPHHLTKLAAGWNSNPRVDGTRDRPLPGGAALVLSAGGHNGGDKSSRRGDRSHASDEHPSDPPSVVGVLEWWEDDWRAFRHDPTAAHAATVTRCTDYLLTHLRWAATTHPVFGDFHNDLRQLHSHLTRVTGNTTRPVPSTAHCLTCRTRLVQHWTETGLSDTHTCPGCKATYTPGQYQQALKAHLTQQAQLRKEDAG